MEKFMILSGKIKSNRIDLLFTLKFTFARINKWNDNI